MGARRRLAKRGLAPFIFLFYFLFYWPLLFSIGVGFKLPDPTQTYGNLYGFLLYLLMTVAKFEWDNNKDAENQNKHHVSFEQAQTAFMDPHRVIARDLGHSETEKRFYCFGETGAGVLTVRFTYRRKVIRIIGAGYWRKGKAVYEKENHLHG